MSAQAISTDSLQRARMRLQLRDPFLGAASLYLDIEPRPLEWFERVAPWTAPTACTDGRKILYYPPFAEALDRAGADFLLAHEVGHCIGGDHARRDSRDPILWNCAGDYAINLMLQEAGWEILKGSLLDTRFANMSKEQIYAILKHEQDEHDQSGGRKGKDHKKGMGRAVGVVIDATGANGERLDSQGMHNAAGEWAVRAQQCADVAKSCGRLHASYQRMVGEVLEPKVPWEEVLRRFVRDARNRRGDDYQWSPPNRRHLWRGLVLPSVERIGMGVLDLHVDLSGSIGPREFNAWVAEIQAVREEARPELTRVIYFDAKVCEVHELGADQRLEVEDVEKVQAGGGTLLAPSIKWVEESGVRPTVAICLTDLYLGDAPEDPGYEWLFVAPVGGEEAPFGRVVRIELDD